MRVSFLRTAAVAAWLLIVTSRVIAFEGEDLERKADAMMQEAAELRRNGHVHEAETLTRKAQELLDSSIHVSESAKRREQQIAELKERLLDLNAAEKNAVQRNADAEIKEIREKTERVRRDMQKLSVHQGIALPPEFQERAEQLERVSMRIRHLRTAGENLRRAEMPDMAHEVMRKAEALEHELVQQKKELAQAFEKHQHRSISSDESHQEVQQLRKEVEQLRGELRAARETMEQLKQLQEK